MRARTFALGVCLVLGSAACGGGGGGDGDGGGGGIDATGTGDPDATIVVDDGGGICVVTPCSGHTLECGDCVDNDGDGNTDSDDVECLGSCDNTEGPALNADVGGESGGPCKADCYFDFGNGSGNDDCHWDHRCDPLAVAPDYPPEGMDCEYDPSMVGSNDCPTVQSDQCLSFCRPLTPNGCDCFGCCAFPELNGGSVWIQHLDDNGDGTCTFADILDPALCPPCTQVESCGNDCATCEICIGETELPPGCEEQVCPDGSQQCGQPGDAECPVNTFCVTGCCVAIVD